MIDRPNENLDDAAIDRLLESAPRSSEPRAPHLDDGLLLAYSTGKLDEAAQRTADDHLARCVECRELLAAMAQPAIKLEVPTRAKVIPLKRRAALYTIAGGALAAAASLLFVLAGPSNDLTMPAYEIATFEGMVQSMRGAPDPAAEKKPVFLPHSRLLLSLRPKEDLTSTPPQARVLLSHEGGPLELAPESALEKGAGGAYRIATIASKLFGDRSGAWSVYVLLTHDADLAASLAGKSAAEAKAEAHDASWLSVDLRYEKESAR